MSEFEKVTAGALALPNERRAELAEILIQSLEEREAGEIRYAWLTEIRRRDKEIRSGAKVTKTALQVLKEAREQLRCTK